MKTVPLEKDISHFIDYKSFDILSEKQYASYVQREADKRKEWAVEMLESVERVSSFWTFWTTHVDLVSRREIGGLCMLCRNIQNSPPLSRSHSKLFLSDCVVTRLKKRPCFALTSTRFCENDIFVHHSLFSRCQSLWSLLHLETLLAALVQTFVENSLDMKLSETCSAFQKSSEKQKLLKYLQIVAEHVVTIFTSDNLFQNYDSGSTKK